MEYSLRIACLYIYINILIIYIFILLFVLITKQCNIYEQDDKNDGTVQDWESLDQSYYIYLDYIMSEKKEKISPEKMIKQAQKTKGYLLKKSSGIIGGWKQRYFIILNGALTYYDDQALEKQKGQIKLKEIQSIIMKSDDLFCLQTPKRQYEFKCSKESDRDLWVASLNLLKQYISDDELAKKFIVKHNLNEKKIDSFQLCGINDVRQALQIMKLNLLAEQLEESRIHQRIYCHKVQKGYYLSVSIKPLQFPDIDQQILAEKYISPYNFNKLYLVHFDGNIQDIAKMSQMQALKTQQTQISITFSDKSKILIPFKSQSESYQISRKLCRCYQVAKQYYNPFKIVLKKNIDRLIYLFDHFKQIFEEQVKYRVNQRLTKFANTETNPVYSFLQQFGQVKKDLIQTEQACKVMIPSRNDMKVAYFKLSHQQIKICLSSVWENLFACFDAKNLVKFSTELYQYWIIVNQIVADTSLLEGCFDLNRFFMGRVGQSIRQKIQLYNAQKVQYKRNKNQPISNELTYVFYQWLKQIGSYMSDTIPLDVIFQQYCDFFQKSFDQFLDYLTEISDTWNETLVIIGACNDLSRIKKYFKTTVGAQICKGIVAQTKFFKICGNEIIRKINECITNLIRRAFVLIFKTIDKKLLAKPFIQIDFARICYQVLQRLQPLKTKVLQEIQYEMTMLSFDQICFFFYTMFISNSLPALKNLKEYYVLAIEKGLIEIEQYYCNIKTETEVKKYLAQISFLKQILICSESSMIKCCYNLYQTFQSSFNEKSIQVILRIRQTSQQSFMRILSNCSKVLTKAPSSQDSQSCQDYHIRSRKSTLTESIYTNSVPDEGDLAKSANKEGYLQVKKTVKGISNFYSKSYCRILNGKLLQYYSPNSNESISSIDLVDVDYCYLDSTGAQKNTFIIITQPATYHFRTHNRNQAGLWIQAIYSEIKRPLFQNKSQFSQKEKKNAIFKNLQAELTTTSSNKRRTGECDEDKFFQMKRNRRIKGVQDEKFDKLSTSKACSNFQISVPKKSKNAKDSKKLSNNKQSQGTCCSANIF